MKNNHEILTYAAKSCGIKGYFVNNEFGIKHAIGEPGKFKPAYFNPIDNSADTASMCAKLEINTFFHTPRNKVECWIEDNGDEDVIKHAEKHDGTHEGKEAAWRLAASMVAAKVGGYSDGL